MKLYTIGYLGRTQDELVGLLQEHTAVLLDIRYAPYSRNPQFTGAALKQRLGEDYLYVQALGNINYKSGGEIKIANFPAGLKLIQSLSRPAVMMCACRDAHSCHRTVVANLLRAEGCEVEELSNQPALFW
jgi:uncharacterized protein (DUF488 family)